MRRALAFSLLFGLSISVYGGPSYIAGEKLYFRAHWNNLTCGYAMLEIVERKPVEGVDHLRFRMRARTSKMMDAIFKVRDSIETTWNEKTRQPLKTSKDLHEGYSIRYYTNTFRFRENVVDFWQKAYLGNSTVFGMKRPDARWNEFSSQYKQLKPETQDLLTSLYYMRTHPEPPRVGKTFSLNVFDDRQFQVIKMTILKKETIKTAVGSFKSFKVSTDFKTKGHFKSTGNIYAWVSDDEHRYPLKVTAQIPLFGTVEAELVKISKPGS